MFIDSHSVAKGDSIEADICIVGSGAAGIAMALELASSDLKIVLLESGGLKRDSETQALYDLQTTDLPISPESRFRVFGGTTTEWAGRWKPHDEIDFKSRSWIPHSGWPITRDELLPYYKRLHALVGAPHPDSYDVSLTDALASKSSLPLLNNDQVETSLFNWLKAQDWNWGKKYKETLEQSNSVTVYLNANVTNINHHTSGSHIDTVSVSTLSHNTYSVRAKRFVLAAGGIENARLLLLSRDQIKAGVGNEHDQVGRYYMDHPKGKVGEIDPSNRRMYLPVYWGVDNESGQLRAGLKLSDAIQEELQLLNSYVLLEPIFPWSYNPGLSAAAGLAKAVRGSDVPRDVVASYAQSVFKNKKTIAHWASSKLFEKVLNRQSKISKIRIWNFMEQLPRPENRVVLGNKKDSLGNEKVVVTWSIADEEKRSMIVFHKLLKKHLADWGLGTLSSPLLDGELDEWPIQDDSSHHMGTTRMGEDPHTSVVDKDCKVHSCDNLFIAGSSVFPTSGYANPTATLTALAVRLAQHVK